MTRKRSTITEREQRVIRWISTLSDKELFGLECFLAGTRVGAREDLTDVKQSKAEKSVDVSITNLVKW